MKEKAIHLRAVVLVSLLGGLLANPRPAQALPTVLYVEQGGLGSGDCDTWANACDLQYALSSVSAGDEVWVQEGLYIPGATVDDHFSLLPGVKLLGGFAGSETAASQRNWTLHPTILSGDIGGDDTTTGDVVMDSNNIVLDNAYHVLWISGYTPNPVHPTDTALDGFTITGGSATNASYPDSYGGGLFCYAVSAGSECSPRLENLVFSGNRAQSGGAIQFEVFSSGICNAELEHVTFRGNRATYYGGAIFVDAATGTGDLKLHNVTFTDNHAMSGGAYYNDGDYSGHADPSLVNVTFDGNSATVDGGALFNTGYQGHASPKITNSTFRLNHADGSGGAMYNGSGSAGTSSPQIVNTTFSSNSGNLGGAIYNYGPGGSTCLPSIANSILWGNTAVTAGNQVYNNTCTPSFHHSDVEDSLPSNVWDGNLGADGGNNLDSDPLLAALSNNGGFTKTMALQTGSPAIDSADDTTCSGDPVNSLDQRGAVRPQGSQCDIGAFEFQVNLFADVPVPGKEWMEPWIIAFYQHGITTGCGQNPLFYCPENQVTRAEMAVFLLRAKHGAGYAPPAPTHDFADVPISGKEWMEPWIEQFYMEGITTGCGGGNYCPENNVTRAEMAVFVLRALHGGSYTPPAGSGLFADVPVSGKEWMEPWIIEFANEGITTGCGGGNFCPENNVTRAEMAVFIDRAYHFYP